MKSMDVKYRLAILLTGTVLILDQVTNGIAVRMAVLYLVSGVKA